MKSYIFPNEIRTKRLILRKHSAGAADAMFEALDSNRKHLGRFLVFVKLTKTLRDQKAYIAGTLQKWRRGELFDYGIYLKGDNQFVGNIGVHTIHWNHKRCEIGYWLGAAFEGCGYVSEAVKEVTKVCFRKGFYRVEIRCSPENTRSSSVAERCGFRLEGHLREDRIVNGKRHDTLIYGRTRGDKSL